MASHDGGGLLIPYVVGLPAGEAGWPGKVLEQAKKAAPQVPASSLSFEAIIVSVCLNAGFVFHPAPELPLRSPRSFLSDRGTTLY